MFHNFWLQYIQKYKVLLMISNISIHCCQKTKNIRHSTRSFQRIRIALYCFSFTFTWATKWQCIYVVQSCVAHSRDPYNTIKIWGLHKVLGDKSKSLHYETKEMRSVSPCLSFSLFFLPLCPSFFYPHLPAYLLRANYLLTQLLDISS